MKNTPSTRWLVLVSPQGHLIARPADYFRRWPDFPAARWQRLTYVRLRDGLRFEAVRDQAYGWAVSTYRL